MKKFVTLILIFVLLFTFTSCAQLNEEKASGRVVATVNGTNITKAEFDKFLNYYEIVYAVNDQSLPTGKDLKDFKEEILTNYTEVQAEYIDALARGYSVADSVYQTNVKNAMDYITQTVGADKLDAFFAEYKTTKADFEAFLNDYYKKLSYTNALEEDFFTIMSADQSLINYKVAKVNGNDLTMDKFLYYVMQEYITQYITGQSTPSTDEEMQTFYKEVITNYAQLEAFYNYATKQGIEITEDEINAQLATVTLYMNYFAPTKADKETMLKQNLLTYDAWEKYSKENAKMLAAKSKIETALKTEIEDYTPTDKEIQKYYDENTAIISGKYMYAKHILFSEDNKAMAETCAQRAKAGENFDTLMAEYNGKDGVTEASDLGRFAKTEMVTEFADAAFKLSVGEVSGVVQSEFGYHVIYAYAAPSLEAEKATITSALKSDYQTEQLAKKEAMKIKAKVKTPKEIKTAYDVYVSYLYGSYNIKIYPSRVK